MYDNIITIKLINQQILVFSTIQLQSQVIIFN